MQAGVGSSRSPGGETRLPASPQRPEARVNPRQVERQVRFNEAAAIGRKVADVAFNQGSQFINSGELSRRDLLTLGNAEPRDIRRPKDLQDFVEGTESTGRRITERTEIKALRASYRLALQANLQVVRMQQSLEREGGFSVTLQDSPETIAQIQQITSQLNFLRDEVVKKVGKRILLRDTNTVLRSFNIPEFRREGPSRGLGIERVDRLIAGTQRDAGKFLLDILPHARVAKEYRQMIDQGRQAGNILAERILLTRKSAGAASGLAITVLPGDESAIVGDIQRLLEAPYQGFVLTQEASDQPMTTRRTSTDDQALLATYRLQVRLAYAVAQSRELPREPFHDSPEVLEEIRRLIVQLPELANYTRAAKNEPANLQLNNADVDEWFFNTSAIAMPGIVLESLGGMPPRSSDFPERTERFLTRLNTVVSEGTAYLDSTIEGLRRR